MFKTQVFFFEDNLLNPFRFAIFSIRFVEIDKRSTFTRVDREASIFSIGGNVP